MEEHINNDIEELNDEFALITKNKSDIINEMTFANDDDKLLCSAIITNVERMIADSLHKMKTVSIPLIGRVRINPVHKEFVDSKLHLSAIRKGLTKEQYREHVRSYYTDLIKKNENKDKEKLVLNKLKRINKTKYEYLFKQCGKAYADLYIVAITLLKEIPFDNEWQETYDILAGIDRDKLLEEDAIRESIEIANYLKHQKRYKFK